MDLYRELVLDHYTNPRNNGVIPNSTHSATFDNPVCGDQVSVTLIVDQQTVRNVKFQTTGCAISIASASLLSEKILHKSVEQIQSLSLDNLIELLGTPLTTSRQQCAMTPLQALKTALDLKK